MTVRKILIAAKVQRAQKSQKVEKIDSSLSNRGSLYYYADKSMNFREDLLVLVLRRRSRSSFVPACSNSEMQFSMRNTLTPVERQVEDEDDDENEDDLVAATRQAY